MTEQAGREMTLEEWVVRLHPDHKARSELATLVAEVAGMRDKWTPPDEVAELQAENAELKRELVSERKNALEAMHCADWITDDQYIEAMMALDALTAEEQEC